jgi:hypothetical protein
MNDLQLLYATETQLGLNNEKCNLDMVTFDTNMNVIYITDHNHIYGIDGNELKVV